MRHRKKSEKFSRPRGQRRALVDSLVKAVIINESITTTTSRAKYLRSKVDRLITLAKGNTLSNRRLAYRKLKSHTLVKRLFDDIGPRFAKISGGYTRVLRVANRKGDNAPLSIFELTKMEKKVSISKKGKAADVVKTIAKSKEKSAVKENKEGIISGVKKIFKKKKNADN